MSRYYRTILNVQSTAIDPDAQAFLTATGIVDATITSAINNLVVGLKSAGLWAKMKAIYPFVGGTATTHKFNLKDPRDLDAAFRITWFGGITHDANGVQGNGTNGYANTFLNPSVAFSADSYGGFFNSNIINNGGSDFGFITAGATNGFQSVISSSGNTFFSRHNSGTLGSTLESFSSGFYGINRINSLEYKHNILGVKKTIIIASVGNVNGTIKLLSNGADAGISGFSNRRYSSFYFTDALTDTDQDNLQTADLAFQTALGR